MEVNQIQKQRAIETHSSQAGEFDDSYRGLGKDAYQSCFTYSRRRLEAMLEHYLPARVDRSMPHRLLDVGCGTGHHMALLRSRGFDVAGVDGSAEMLEHARETIPTRKSRSLMLRSSHSKAPALIMFFALKSSDTCRGWNARSQRSREFSGPEVLHW